MNRHSSQTMRSWPDYAAVWRLHFYAGIFCIPFVMLLSISGTIYLFRPQIEAWSERYLDALTLDDTSTLVSYADQVRGTEHAPAAGW